MALASIYESAPNYRIPLSQARSIVAESPVRLPLAIEDLETARAQVKAVEESNMAKQADLLNGDSAARTEARETRMHAIAVESWASHRLDFVRNEIGVATEVFTEGSRALGSLALHGTF